MCGRTACTVRGGGGRKPGQSGQHVPRSRAPLADPTNRHSRAMHLYDAGVPLPYIRDILGHADLSTTEIYARASTEAKRKALEAVYDQVVSAELTEWNQDPELLSWLTNLR